MRASKDGDGFVRCQASSFSSSSSGLDGFEVLDLPYTVYALYEIQCYPHHSHPETLFLPEEEATLFKKVARGPF